MNDEAIRRIGFVCSYTPLPMIAAAGFVPYRILPLTKAPEQAGTILHDNLCPHVKRVLDQALAGDVPELAGVVFMNSCETMRRLGDAWRKTRPTGRQIMLDLPSAGGPLAEEYFAGELRGLSDALTQWGGAPVRPEALAANVEAYNGLANRLLRLAEAIGRTSGGGWLARLQETRNLSVTAPPAQALAAVDRLESALPPPAAKSDGLPIYLFGNVLPDPEAWELFENAGFRLAGDDLCTGARQLTALDWQVGEDPYRQLAKGLLARRPCARTLTPASPGNLAVTVAREAQRAGAWGVVAHVMKFCDPYLARLPRVRETLKEAGLPLLVLEGDCTLRSWGQQRTRLEAFAEMLRGANP